MVKELCDQVGRTISSGSGKTTISCVATIMSFAKKNPDQLKALWPVIAEITKNKPINHILIEGLMHIELRMPQDQSLSDAYWRKRILRIGNDYLLEAAQKAAAFYARGGAGVWAQGMLQALNYKRRKERLEIAST